MNRIPGGEKNDKSGTPWSERELKEVYHVYKRLGGEGLHERNPAIIDLAISLERTIRSTEAQTLMFRNLDRGGDYSHGNMNKLCKKIWLEMEGLEQQFTEPNLFYPNMKTQKTGKYLKKPYPAGLLDWAGHRRGGVKKPFDKTSGRPNGVVIHTRLTRKIDEWVLNLNKDSPRIILLIGGPGNGKTDALEYLIAKIDSEFSSSYYEHIFKKIKDAGNLAPRAVEIDLNINHFGRKKLRIVQDASTGKEGLTSGECLIKDLEEILDEDTIYIAGINRGILAEAVSKAESNQRIYNILNGIIQGLTQYIQPKPLWPMGDNYPFNNFAIWPMDVESLVRIEDTLESTPAFQIISDAVSEDNWNCDECTFQEHCPFFQNKKTLQNKDNTAGLLQILSDYEIIANKRWSFRELFSLISYIIVGTEQEFNGYNSPCDWAKKQAENIYSGNPKLRIQSSWNLNEHLYHTRLFNKWPAFSSVGRANKRINKEVADILAYSPITKEFFGYFTYIKPRRIYKPDIAELIEENFFNLMDPSQLSNENTNFNKLLYSVRDLEGNFSYSVESGYELVKEVLNPLEDIIYQQLMEIEKELDSQVRFESSISSMRIDEILGLIRSIATRYFKRIHFLTKGISKDEFFLKNFRELNPNSDPDSSKLKSAKNLFDDLVQERNGLKIILNSSISQPQLESEMQISLEVSRVKIKHNYIADQIKDVPRTEMKVFIIMFREESFNIPLTYQLYKALLLLQEGVRPSSLPTAVISMLDSIQSKMAGEIVRDSDILLNSKLTIGASPGYYRIDDTECEIEITPQK